MKPKWPMKPKQEVDLEEDEMIEAWAVAPSEACWFTSLAVFRNRKHAQDYANRINKSKRLSGSYADCVVVPARASVTCANTLDVKAGRAALKEEGES